MLHERCSARFKHQRLKGCCIHSITSSDWIIRNIFLACQHLHTRHSLALRVVSIIFNNVSGVGSRDEERLVRDLFRGYNKLIRPVQNMTQKVQVAFGLAFIQLINVVSIPCSAAADGVGQHCLTGNHLISHQMHLHHFLPSFLWCNLMLTNFHFLLLNCWIL